MTSPLRELLSRLLPGRADVDDAARVSVVGGGVELGVTVHGLGRRLVHVSCPEAAEPPFFASDRVVLRIVLGDGATRVDVPVEVTARGRTSMIVRILSAPLVLRRRMVRDQALEEALSARAPTAPHPMVA
jgi:hypothetical protein